VLLQYFNKLASSINGTSKAPLETCCDFGGLCVCALCFSVRIELMNPQSNMAQGFQAQRLAGSLGRSLHLFAVLE